MERERDMERKIGREMESEREGSYSNSTTPLLNGFLTGQYYALLRCLSLYCYARAAQLLTAHHLQDPHLSSTRIQNVKIAAIQMLRRDELLRTPHITASLGVFEILTEKLKSTYNKGRPLSLYQEACCGLISGATAANIYLPLHSAYSKTDPKNFSYKSFVMNLINGSNLALWKGSGLFMATQMTANMGMLVSYNRSVNYLRDNTSLTKFEAQLSASVVSALFASGCSHPWVYAKAVMEHVQKECNKNGKVNAYRMIPGYISQILTPYSGFKFYTRFFNCFNHNVRFCMVQWSIYETIRSADEEDKHTLGNGKD